MMFECDFHERYALMSVEERAKMREAAHRWMVRMAGSEEKLAKLEQQYRTGKMIPSSALGFDLDEVLK